MSDLIRRGSRGLPRDINNSRVLNLIQAQGPISRAEIAKTAQIPPPTVTHIVAQFIAAGLVREVEVEARSYGLGRPPILLVLEERAAFAVGVKLRQGGLTVAVTDLNGGIVSHREYQFPTGNAADVLENVATEVRAALGDHHIDASVVLGIGIGMPGVIDHAGGMCRYSSLLGWTCIDVKQQLEDALELPVYVDNDVNMLTAFEIAFGAGREIGEFLIVTIGRGIGLGIVIHGEIYRGWAGGAGEFGHTKIGTQLPCECGNIGCLEALASETAICEQVALAHGLTAITVEDAVALARAEDSSARAIFNTAGSALGRSVGNLINVFNPRRVIVTGEGTRMGNVFLEPMCQAIEETTFSLLGDDVQILTQQWGDEAWAQGAAAIVIHEMLRVPIYESTAIRPLGQLLGRASRQPTGRR